MAAHILRLSCIELRSPSLFVEASKSSRKPSTRTTMVYGVEVAYRDMRNCVMAPMAMTTKGKRSDV